MLQLLILIFLLVPRRLRGRERVRLRIRKPTPEFRSGGGDVLRVEDGRDDTDAGRSGFEDGIEVFQGDAADGEPGNGHVGRGPADVVERDGGTPRFGARGKNGSDGDVVRSGGDGAYGLLGSVGAEADQRE